MIAGSILQKAVTLLGYDDPERFAGPGLTALNTVYADLFEARGKEGFREIRNLTENVLLPDRDCVRVMPFGVAAYLARHVGDSNNQAYFAAEYNLRRRPAARGSIVDTFPTPEQ